MINAAAIAAGEYQSIAVTDSGTVSQWGEYSNGTNKYSVSNYSAATAPPGSNVVAVAAGLGHALALLTNGAVVAWGLTTDTNNAVPTNVSHATAIAAGWMHNVALLTNGTVFAWGDDTYHQTEVPSNLSNVVAIAAGGNHSLALMSNGMVVVWGDTNYGLTNIPPEVTNVVAVAAGAQHSLALKSDGTVIAWGNNDFGQTNVPTGMSNFMAIAAGDGHSLALINDGTIVSWGTNSYGQTNHFSQGPGVAVKLIAAGGNHSMAALFSSHVQYYPIDISKDLLLIYNTNSIDSSNVCQYYLTHRPMVSNANLLGIGCTTLETILPGDFTTNFQPQVQMWLSNNPTKRPSYVILFPYIPSRVFGDANDTNSQGVQTNYSGIGAASAPSVQYELNQSCSTNWHPFVTSINMNGTNGSYGTNDCIAYINKLAYFGSNCPGQLIISASMGVYGNTNWYFDNNASGNYTNTPAIYNALGAYEGILSNGISSSSVDYQAFTSSTVITNGTNVAGYFTWGNDGTFSGDVSYPITGIVFSGASSWCLFYTTDSFSGMRNINATGQANFLEWFSPGAFGGTNYTNTPVAAVSHVNEPFDEAEFTDVYFGLWAEEKTFAICAWTARNTPSYQAVGDPLVRK